MPIIKSAKKKARQALKHQARNYLTRTAVRKSIRGFLSALKVGKKEEAEAALSKAYKAIDLATKKHILNRNTAARRKSLLARKLAKA